MRFLSALVSVAVMAMSYSSGASASHLLATTLTVSNLTASALFYESLGFRVTSNHTSATSTTLHLSFPSTPAARSQSLRLTQPHPPSSLPPNIPIKLAIFTSSVADFQASLLSSGVGKITHPGAENSTGFARDPDGYLVEYNNKAAVNMTTPPGVGNVFTGTGIGGEVLDHMRAFYEAVFGARVSADLKFPGLWDEYILRFARGIASLVVMNWTDGKEYQYRDVPVGLVMAVEDVEAVVGRVVENGGEVVEEVKEGKAVVKDLYGYTIEVVEMEKDGGASSTVAPSQTKTSSVVATPTESSSTRKACKTRKPRPTRRPKFGHHGHP